MKFFGDGAAADHFAAFENQGLESALGEIKRGDECVVTAADENYALSDGHVQLFSCGGTSGAGAAGSELRQLARHWMTRWRRPIFSTL